jgi:hypothetical protein
LCYVPHACSFYVVGTLIIGHFLAGASTFIFTSLNDIR